MPLKSFSIDEYCQIRIVHYDRMREQLRADIRAAVGAALSVHQKRMGLVLDVENALLCPLSDNNISACQLMYGHHFIGTLVVDLEDLKIHYTCNHSGVKDRIMMPIGWVQ